MFRLFCHFISLLFLGVFFLLRERLFSTASPSSDVNEGDRYPKRERERERERSRDSTISFRSTSTSSEGSTPIRPPTPPPGPDWPVALTRSSAKPSKKPKKKLGKVSVEDWKTLVTLVCSFYRVFCLCFVCELRALVEGSWSNAKEDQCKTKKRRH